ncbi:MAG: hypothetical protein ACKVVT_09170 [Dehalococcoidia bacterium]
MGRRKSRKQERRQQKRDSLFGGANAPVSFEPRADPFDLGLHELSVDDFAAFWPGESRARAVKACGNCREFVEDAEGGRGTCLHPGSGILSPWTDTPPCDFHHARRR